MIYLHRMVSTGMFTLSLSQPHALSVSPKACFKHCPTISRPLHLCTSQRLHVFHDDGCPHFPTEGSVKLSNVALNKASWDRHFVGRHVKIYVKLLRKKGPWTGISWSWWCRTYCVCRTNWCQGWISCINGVGRTTRVCMSWQCFVTSEGPRFMVFSPSRCCQRCVR